LASFSACSTKVGQYTHILVSKEKTYNYIRLTYLMNHSYNSTNA
jgi:hypothetical protein